MSGHVVIVGGGISGLAAAEHLTRQEPRPRVTLLEASARLGGHIRTERRDGFVMEAGPDVLLAAKPAAIELARRVGIGDRLIGTSPRARGSYIWTRHGLVRMPEGMTGLVPSRARPFITTSLLTPADKVRVGIEYFIPPRRDEADESVESFVVRRLGKGMYERFAEPLLSGISAGDGSRLSMATMFPQLRALEREHGGLVRGMLASRRAAPQRSNGGTPASAFLSFPGGLAELVDAVTRTIEARSRTGGITELRTSAAVRSIARNIAGDGFALELFTGETIVADAVLIAAPAFAASRLLEGIGPALSQRLAEIEYESTVTVSLAFGSARVPRALDATGYVVPRDLGRPVLACTWASAKFEHRAPQGYSLFRVFLGGAKRRIPEHASDEDLRELATREMHDVMGIRSTPVLCRVDRFDRAMPQYHVGHLDRVATIQSLAAGIPGLYLAGAAYGGVGIPDCVSSGERAAAAAWRYIADRVLQLDGSAT
jgi:protoporphyrinogen/coproporphyrinogen III oxidase